jgi:hypothetical protein
VTPSRPVAAGADTPAVRRVKARLNYTKQRLLGVIAEWTMKNRYLQRRVLELEVENKVLREQGAKP